MSKYLEYAVITSRGFVRQNNEDNFYVNCTVKEQNTDEMELTGTVKQDVNLMAVCDGMGGEEAGEVASYCTVTHVEEAWEGEPTGFVRYLNRVVLEQADKQGFSRMGSTISFLVHENERIVVGNVGDSRNYRVHERKMMRTSKDHSQAQFLMELGLMTEEEAVKSDAWHILVQYLGIDEEEALLVPFVNEFEFVPEDQYLLCSDGLTDMVAETDIENVLLSEKTLQKKADKLVRMAMQGGGKDNITILLVKCREEK